MELQAIQGDITKTDADCLVVNLFAGVTTLGGATGAVDAALDGAISFLIRTQDFTGEAGTTALLYTKNGFAAPRVLLVGLGKQEKFDLHAARKAASVAAKALRRLKGVNRFATILHGAGAGGLEAQAAAQALAEGTLLALYQSPQYRREEKRRGPSAGVIVEFDGERLPQIEAGVAAGQALALGVKAARDYVSEPPNLLFPAEFARRAEAMAAEVGLQCTVLGEKKMRELGMNILLAVSKGSKRAAKLIILEHRPAGQTQETSEEAPLVLVGKGVTFDTGGISIKPAENMWRMKSDMGGAAAVVGAMETIARLKLPRRVIGLAVCVENMPDGKAFRPGDIWTGITGKSAEIISTDAEGRLILADALGYVAQYNPKAVVDLATLTGAIGVALGSQAAGLFANDDALQEALLAAAKASGERLWPMPMYDEYKDEIKSDMAEVKNSAARTSGVAASAKFIEHFTEGYPWAHLDIASMVWDQSDGNPLSPKGATGYGVRLLVELTKAY
ncbi:MAG: leucyl aminopeptidase [Caldilineaceae bacterium]|nr:leucyl aminopeptidase [Caldilineaceae bacterium]